MQQFRCEGHNEAEGKAVGLPAGIRNKCTARSWCMAKPLHFTMVPQKTLPHCPEEKTEAHEGVNLPR